MRWKSHLAIARELARQAGLPPHLEEALCQGCVEPDIHPDSLVEEKSGRVLLDRMPHHVSSSRAVRAYLWKARFAYLAGNDYWAMKCLGRALHYLQDQSVSVGFLGLQHGGRENAISRLRPDPEDVRRGMESAFSSPRFVDGCLRQIRPRRRSHDAMRQASYYSAALMTCVLDGSRTEHDFWADYVKVMRTDWLMVIPLCIGLLLLGGFASYLSNELIYVLFGAALGPVIIKLDYPYRRLRAEAKWFNLR